MSEALSDCLVLLGKQLAEGLAPPPTRSRCPINPSHREKTVKLVTGPGSLEPNFMGQARSQKRNEFSPKAL